MRTLLALALAWLASCAPAVGALPAAAAEGVSVAYRNAPLSRVVAELARATGETAIFDDSLRGSITVEGPGRVSSGEARALLDSILLLRGFAALPAPGGGLKIVPLVGAPSPWRPEGELSASDAPVTTLLRLENIAALDLVAVLLPLLGAQGVVQPYEPTNSLILAGPSSRLRRLRTAIEALDRADPRTQVFWRLRYADASAVAEQLQEVLGEDAVPLAFGDVRTNTLVLGLHREDVERARRVVHRLDRPAAGFGVLQVIPVVYADPEALAEQLRALQEGAEEEAGPGRRAGLQGSDFSLAVDRATRSLVVRAAPETFQTMLDVVHRLDRVPPRVRVEATVAEVTFDGSLALGFDWRLPGINDPRRPDDLIVSVASQSSGGIQSEPSTERPVVAFFERKPLVIPVTLPNGTQVPFEILRESASLTLNRGEVRSEVLIRPQLVAASGEDHELFAGDNVPIAVAQADATNPLQTRQNVERQDIGTTFRVRPTLGQEGGVLLEVSVERSSLGRSAAGDVSAVGPTIRQILVESRIHLRGNEVAVVATAAEPQVQKSVRGVPWLMDVPFLGAAFRSSRESVVRRYLLVMVEAEILRPERAELARALVEELSRAEAEAPPRAD